MINPKVYSDFFRKHFLKLILSSTLVVVATYNGCSLPTTFERMQGTTVGNPMRPVEAASQILFSVCSVLNRCQSKVRFNDCLVGVQATSGLSKKLGLPTGSFEPFVNLFSAEQSGVVVANPTATDLCSTTINSLPCNDPTVENAYTSGATNPYGGVVDMIPDQKGSCKNVYSDLQVYPNSITLNLNTTHSFTPSGGIPPYTFSVTGDPSSTGTISTDGNYISASSIGVDTITVTDSVGHTADAIVKTDGSTVFLIGGYLGGPTTAEVLVGKGTNWISSGAPLPMGAVESAQTLVVNDSIYLLGGDNGSPSSAMNSIFKSSNGTAWTQVGTFPGAAQRTQGVALSFQNKLWYLGGADGSGSYSNVWNSSDGTNWTNIGNSLPRAMVHFSGVVFKGKMWIAGGTNWTNIFSEVYSSVDGVNWLNAGQLPRALNRGAMVVYQGKIWWFGGSSNSGSSAQIWTSTDGVSWNPVGNNSIPGGPDYGHSVSVYQNKLLFSSGYSSAGGTFSSVDGLTWSPVVPFSSGTFKTYTSMAVFTPATN